MSNHEGSVQRVHIAGAALVLVVAGLAGAWLGVPHSDPPPVAIERRGTPGTPETGTAPNPITVYVAGAVHVPGLVTLAAGDRIADAIFAAGGALYSAELSGLNLAAIVHDGDQVTVPVRGTPVAPGPHAGSNAEGLVDVNAATAEDLEALPGVGPVLARRIFDYREEHGRFSAIEDLLDVPGIGEGKLATLREAAVLR